MRSHEWPFVSILLVMDDGLGGYGSRSVFDKPKCVSILLVMDDGLGVCEQLSKQTGLEVSILLVMDDGLGDIHFWDMGRWMVCLNPSCNG